MIPQIKIVFCAFEIILRLLNNILSQKRWKFGLWNLSIWTSELYWCIFSLQHLGSKSSRNQKLGRQLWNLSEAGKVKILTRVRCMQQPKKMLYLGQGNLWTGQGALPVVQMSINFKLICWKKEEVKLCLSKQLTKKLINNCASRNVPFPCLETEMSRFKSTNHSTPSFKQNKKEHTTMDYSIL